MKRAKNHKFKSIINFLAMIAIIVITYLCCFTLFSHVNFSHFLWRQNYISQTKNISSSSQNLREIAKIDHIKRIPSPAKINTHLKNLGSLGKTYGWLDAMGIFLKPQKEYILHFSYHSQLYPLYAPDACEASSLRMALSTKGLAKHISMRKFINRIPRSENPNKGYTKNPYYYGDSASIYPDALAKYARKYYHADVEDISGSSKGYFIKQIKHGNPIVFEGSYQMKHINSDHTLVILGYRAGKPGQFLIADPFVWKSQGNKVFWTSTSDFMSIYKGKLRGEKALVVK